MHSAFIYPANTHRMLSCFPYIISSSCTNNTLKETLYPYFTNEESWDFGQTTCLRTADKRQCRESYPDWVYSKIRCLWIALVYLVIIPAISPFHLLFTPSHAISLLSLANISLLPSSTPLDLLVKMGNWVLQSTRIIYEILIFHLLPYSHYLKSSYIIFLKFLILLYSFLPTQRQFYFSILFTLFSVPCSQQFNKA